MEFYRKIIFTITIGIILSFLTYKFCYLIAEKYFFDKFFYQKSVEHGYWITNKKIGFKDFGKRSEDLVKIIDETPKEDTLDIQSNDLFKIAIIGDSFVWGQGLTDDQRFVEILSKKLNKIRPTKIYSLGGNGDNIFDNLAKYNLSNKRFGKMDIYIFGLVNNDLLFNREEHHFDTENSIINKYTDFCKGPKIYAPQPNEQDLYSSLVAKSLDVNSQNYCIFEKITSGLPGTNAIFIDLGNIIQSDTENQKQFSKVISQYFPSTIIPSPNNYPRLSYWDLVVSRKETGHPSATANKIFTDILYDEITTNPKWNFIF